MKTLLLMRHAKSSWDDPQLSDTERPLNARGRRDAPRMGQHLLKQKLIPDHVVTSTAARALETADLLAAECGDPPILTTSNLYHATTDEWSESIATFPDSWQCALCIGHNPGLEEFLAILTGQYLSMPTAAIAHMSVDLSQWSRFTLGAAVALHDVWRPKELKHSQDEG